MRISLSQLLASRDERQKKERELTKRFPDKTLMVFTVVVPGDIKRDRRSLTVAEAGMNAIKKSFGQDIVHTFTYDLETGFEAFFIIGCKCDEAKLMACEIENTHTLGRLMDIDVFDDACRPISRQTVKKEQRKCLICENDSRVCMRLRNHTLEELSGKIDTLINSYVRRL